MSFKDSTIMLGLGVWVGQVVRRFNMVPELSSDMKVVKNDVSSIKENGATKTDLASMEASNTRVEAANAKFQLEMYKAHQAGIKEIKEANEVHLTQLMEAATKQIIEAIEQK
jgi:predicted small secreted protein